MQQAPEGTQRRNKRTGEVQVMQGGQWVSQGGGLPRVIEGPPKQPSPQTPTQVATDEVNLELKRTELGQKDKELRGKDIDRETGLRKEFEGLDAVKQYRTVLPMFASAMRAGDNGAGDLNIIYALGKTMDPTSAVREGELELASTTGSAGEQLKGYFQQVSRGGRLTPTVRQQLLSELRVRSGAIADAYNQVRSQYKGIGGEYGMDPGNIVGQHPGAPFQQAEADFLGRPVRNLDGSQGAAPSGSQPQQSNPLYAQLEQEYRAQGLEVDYDENGKPIPVLTGASVGNPEARQAIDAIEGQPGITDLITHGATLGLSDEAAGVGGALANIISAPFSSTELDPAGAYTAFRDAERARLDQARQNTGWGGTAAEFGGALASGNVSGAVAPALSLGGRMLQGARAGAAGGAIGGFGYGEGANSLLTALGGAAGGAAIGGALPVAGTVIGNRVEGARRLTGSDSSLPRRLVNEAIEADSNTPAAVGALMDEARTRGSPMMLADTGDNARELLASVGRQPGASRTIVREAVAGRQGAQSERIIEAVHRDLGPTANIQELSESLIEQAKTAAGPIYRQFYEKAGASSVRLDDLLARPSIRSALARAQRIAAEEGRDPTALGFGFNEAGETTLERVPSFQTLDYLKQGLDDVVESYRNPTTGRLELNKEGRAVNATLRTLIARIDKVAPEYAQARSAYAGPAAMTTALQKGVKALSKTPDDISVMMRDMGDSEREAFRLGLRKAIVNLVQSKRDGGDKVAALIGTPKSRAALTQAFGGRAEFDRFIATLRDEELMGQTHRAVFGNSATAGRVAQDAQTMDEGLAEGVVDSALRGETLWGSAVRAFQKLREVERFGAGEAGQRAREGVAALLSETDPAVLRDLIAAARAAMGRQSSRNIERSRNAVRVGRNAGNVAGMGAGSLSKE